MILTAVGNYPRVPPAAAPNLRTAINQFDAGRIGSKELQRIEDLNTEEVLREQAEAGLDLVTDGQLRWDDGFTYFAKKIKGFSINGLIRYFDTNTYYRQPIAEEKLRWDSPISVKGYQFAASHSTRPVKAVVTGPYTLAKLSQGKAYPQFKAFVMELAEILNQEALALQSAGAPLVQFDEPAILKYPQDFPLFREAMQRLIKGLTVKAALYTWFRGIDSLYLKLLNLPFNVFGLDFAMGASNWETLKEFPQDKELGLGIMDARNTKLESVEEIVGAIHRIKKVVPLERLHVSPSCGLDYLPRKNAQAKLVRMAEGAKKAQEVLS